MATINNKIAPISDISLTPFRGKDTAAGFLPPRTFRLHYTRDYVKIQTNFLQRRQNEAASNHFYERMRLLSYILLLLNRHLHTDVYVFLERAEILIVHADAALGGARPDARGIVRAVDADAVPCAS